MAITANTPKKSPSLDEFEQATITDENGNVIPVLAITMPNSSGQTGIALNKVQVNPNSQVTGKFQPPFVKLASGKFAQLFALAGFDGNNALTVLRARASVFASTVQTGTGSSQNIAHGLGVTPSAVLVSIYDTNGVAVPYAISEGAHDATNVKVTMTASVKYKVLAFI